MTAARSTWRDPPGGRRRASDAGAAREADRRALAARLLQWALFAGLGVAGLSRSGPVIFATAAVLGVALAAALIAALVAEPAHFPRAAAARRARLEEAHDALPGTTLERLGERRTSLLGRRRRAPVEVRLWTGERPPEEADDDVLVVRAGDRTAVAEDAVLRLVPARPRGEDEAGVRATVPAAYAALWRERGPALEAAAAAVFERFATAEVRVSLPGGVELREPARADRLAPERLEALLDAALDVLHAAGRAPAAVELDLAARAGAAATTCPYCRDALAPRDAAACDGCGTAHHAACLLEVGQCTVAGCRRRWTRGRAGTR